MPIAVKNLSSRGITLPPSGWVLAVLLAVYIFTGLIGHDPWKHDDAITIGVAYDIVRNGNWLLPHLAGQPYPDAPLYYWLAAIMSQLFSWLLPVHDAVRLVSGLFTLLALQFILLAARELHGREHAAAAPLILAGSIGFLFHAHEAQPMLAALTAHTAAYWALVLRLRRPHYASLIFGTAVALGFLANGLLPVLALLPISVLSLWRDADAKRDAAFVTLALVVVTLLCGLWLLPLHLSAPRALSAFAANEVAALTSTVAPWLNIGRYLNMLLWYAWPALPLAAWALWAKRRLLASRELALPALSFLGVLLLLGFCIDTRSAPALLLLPPLVLLAVPGVGSLRRGAANAFDWFGMMTFTLFAAVVWIGWCAMVFGWPARLARQAVRLEPGFVGEFGLVATVASLAATAIWFWLIATSPRSPLRGIMHWMAGLTLFWLLVAALWMPWIDYGKSYRPLSAALVKALPAKPNCIASANVAKAILGTLDYFDGIRTLPLGSEAARRCSWLLLHGQARDPAAIAAAGWREVWTGKRPGDRHAGDLFHLYRRSAKGTSALSEIDVVEAERSPSAPQPSR